MWLVMWLYDIKNSYNLILIIVDWLTKMIYYELVKVTIDVLDLVKVIINVVVYYHRIPDWIVIDWDLLFQSKFWSLLCYFLKIKKSYL